MSNPSVIVGEGEKLVVLTETGELIWNNNAAAIIADDAYWTNENLCYRAIFKILWDVQKQPENSRAAFQQLSIAMPTHITQDTNEWHDLFNWKLWQQGVAFGNWSPEVKVETATKLSSSLEELCAAFDIIQLKLDNNSPILGEIVPKTKEIIDEITNLLKVVTHNETTDTAPTSESEGKVPYKICW